MRTARYRFVRDGGLPGVMSSDRPSTDALKALAIWQSGTPERRYEVQVDENNILEADLTWNDRDRAVGVALDDSCRSVGVTQSFVPWR